MEDLAVLREFFEAGEATDAELKDAYIQALAAAGLQKSYVSMA